MGDAAGNVEADDVAFGVDPRGSSGRGVRGINGGEIALVKQEAMLNAACNVRADDVALIVYA